MPSVEFHGITYASIKDVPGIPTVRDTKNFIQRRTRTDRKLPPIAKRTFGEHTFLSYRGANLFPCIETYRHTLKIADVVKQMARSPFSSSPLVIADIGTGSGIIAITLVTQLQRESNITVVATDISGTALEVAALNARINQTEGIHFRKRDCLEGLTAEFGKLDVVISNPPYFPTNGIRPRYRRNDFIPLTAIDGGNDGMDIYRKLFAQAKDALSDKGIIVVEHMKGQHEQVLAVAQSYLPGAATAPLNGSRRDYTGLVVGNPTTVSYFSMA